MISLTDCQDLDRKDNLLFLRDAFSIPDWLIYLDGNTLGALPKSTMGRMAMTVQSDWGEGLVRSWATSNWLELPKRVGDKIGSLIGAKPDETVVSDSTSINLYKVMWSALELSKSKNPNKVKVLAERSWLSNDMYIAENLCKDKGFELVLVEAHELAAHIALGETAVLLLSHVNYRTGAMHDMAALSLMAHQEGCLSIWDLAHSAGIVPLDVHAFGADFIVGCGHKYLNGGPGAPAFLWVKPNLLEQAAQPLAGAWLHDQPHPVQNHFQVAENMARYGSGSPSILALTALDCGVDTVLSAGKNGEVSVSALRKKSLALTDLFISLVEQECSELGFRLLTPVQHARRGSQVSYSREEGAYEIIQALAARGVIGDFIPGEKDKGNDILRFGLSPLYIRYTDIWDAVQHLKKVMKTGEWRRKEFRQNYVFELN